MNRLLGATLLLLAVFAPGAAAAAPQSWTVEYAGESVLQTEGAVGAICDPVGPVLARSADPRYGEVVCEVDTAGGPRYPLGIQPTSNTTYRKLDPRKPRPVGTTRTGGTPRWTKRIVAIDLAKHELELADEAGWKVSGRTSLLAGWRNGDSVTIDPGGFYTVVDVTRGQSLTGTFLGFGAVVPPPASTGSDTRPSTEPGPVAERVAKATLAGNFAAEWESLHPAFRAVAPKARFVACERAAMNAGPNLVIRQVEAGQTLEGKGTVPLVGKTLHLAEVTVDVTYTQAGGSPGQSQLALVKLRLVPYDGKWVRVLGANEVAAYKAGRCP